MAIKHIYIWEQPIYIVLDDCGIRPSHAGSDAFVEIRPQRIVSLLLTPREVAHPPKTNVLILTISLDSEPVLNITEQTALKRGNQLSLLCPAGVIHETTDIVVTGLAG